jgi:hypothetical protein
MKRLKQANTSPAANGSSKQAAAAGAAGTAQPPARQSALDRLETGPATTAPGKGAGRRAATTAQQRQSPVQSKAAATAAPVDRCLLQRASICNVVAVHGCVKFAVGCLGLQTCHGRIICWRHISITSCDCRSGDQQLQRKGKQPIVFTAKSGK